MNQKTTFAIAAALVGGIGISIASPWNPKTASLDPMPIVTSHASKKMNQNSRADLETKKSSLGMDIAGVKHVKVKLEIAEVILSTHASSAFSAEITKGVSRPVGDKERQWLDNPWIKAKRDGDTLVVYEDKSLKPDLSHRSDSRNDHYQINIKVQIDLPSGLDADVSVDAGTAAASGDFQSLTTHISAGQLNLDHFESRDFLKIDLGAGEVNAKLSSAPSGDSTINVSVGQINLDAKGNATVEARTGIGSITVSGETKERGKDDKDTVMGSKQQIRLGSGGSKLTLDVGAGNIKLGSGVTEKRSKGDEFDMDLDLGKGIKSDFADSDEIKAEVANALREARSVQIDGSDIHDEIAKAMKEAGSIQIDSKKLQGEIEKAMKEAGIEMDSAFKNSDKEIAQAMKEIDIEMKNNKDLGEPYRGIARDALDIAKKSLRQAMITAKKAIAQAKLAASKAGNKKPVKD